MNQPGSRVIYLRDRPGMDGWQPPEPPPVQVDRLGDRAGLVLFAAADASATGDRFGLGAFLAISGRSILAAGLLVSDDLSARKPKTLGRLREWGERQTVTTPAGQRPWMVATLSDFFDPMATVADRPWAFSPRAYSGCGFVVGADLGRTFALVAEHISQRRRTKDSWEVWLPGWGVEREDDKGWHPRSPHRPSLRIDSRRVGWQIEFGPVEEHNGKRGPKGRLWRGAFVDTLTLGYALDADRGASFAEHRANFGLDPHELPIRVPVNKTGAEAVTSAVFAIHRLALTLDDKAGEWFTTPEDRSELRGRVHLARSVSPSALAAAIPARFKLTPPLQKFTLTSEEHQAVAESFHGGWTDADPRLLGVSVPVVNADLSSAYPLVAHHLGWWSLMKARSLRRHTVTEALRRLCARAASDPSIVLDSNVWRRFGFTFAEVMPDGERFTVTLEDPRRPEGRSEVLPMWSPHRPMFYTWLDVVAAAVLTGRVPRILRAVQLVPGEPEPTPRRKLPVLPGLVLDVNEDPVLALVRHRRQVRAADPILGGVLHAATNALVSGNPSRFDEIHRRKGRQWVVDERPGPWTFLPIASCVTAGARLLLAVLDRMASDLGGTVAYRDTDSSLIPASPEGGKLDLPDGSIVQLLSWAEVDAVLGAFGPLSPEPDWPVWKKERGTEGEPLHTAIFRPKRHVEYLPRPDGPEIIDHTEANLGGMFADPPTLRGRQPGRRDRRWTKAVARASILRAETGQRTPAPWDEGQFSSFPTLRRLSVTTPEVLRSLPASLGARLASRYLEAVVDPRNAVKGSVVALDPGGDLANWRELRWIDRSTGVPVKVSTDWLENDGSEAVVMLETLSGRASGWTARDPSEPITEVVVDPVLIQHVGRVSGIIDAHVAGLPGDLAARRPVYAEADRLAAVQQWAAALGTRAFARRTGLPLKVAHRAALGQRIAARNVTKALRALQVDDGRWPRCPVDGKPVYRAGAIYCSTTCGSRRKRRQRSRTKGEETC